MAKAIVLDVDLVTCPVGCLVLGDEADGLILGKLQRNLIKGRADRVNMFAHSSIFYLAQFSRRVAVVIRQRET